jgi:hypothetical protein
VELGIPLIVVALLLLALNFWLRRSKQAREQAAPADTAAEKAEDLARLRPPVRSMHVRGDEVQVTFDVPISAEDDDVLSEFLVSEAVEYVREKQHTLPMSQVNHVVVLAGRDGEREIGRASLVEPGRLPPRSEITQILNLSAFAPDPLEAGFDPEGAAVPETVASTREDELPPLSEDVRLPKAVELGLRAQGIDPDAVTAGQLFTGILGMFGYRVSQLAPGSYTAEKGGVRTFIREVAHQPGDHPSLGEGDVRKFVVDFQTSRADRGVLVTEKYGTFAMYDVERRDPRTRFVVRERMQRTIDYLALS